MSISGNLNYLKKIMRHPCGTPSVEILVETAFQAAIPNLFKLTLFGCNDIMKMKIGRSPWHTRALKGLIESVHTPSTRAGNRFLFNIEYNTVEKYLWWWMVADAATSFAADWASLVYQEAGCAQPRSGYERSPLTALYISGGSTGQVFINDVQSKPCYMIGGNQVQIREGCTGDISYHCEWIPFLGLDANKGSVTSWVVENETGKIFDQSESTPTGFNGAHQTIGIIPGRRATVAAPQSYKIMYRVNQGLMGCQTGHLSVSAYGRHIPLVGAGCTPRVVEMPFSVISPAL